MAGKYASHGGNLARAASLYGFKEKDLIDFSANINPLGPPPGVYRAIIEQLWRIEHYPDPDCGDLPRLLADHLGVGMENLVLGNGGAEIIYILPRALKINRALVLAPTFSEYSESVAAGGGEARYILPDGSGPLSLAEQIADCLPGADALYICNPNNPTGQLLNHSSLIPVVEAAEKAGVTVIVDEAFMDFAEDRDNSSLMSLACRRRGLVALYSMTKFFGIPGLRLGAAVAGPGLIRLLKKAKDPWSVNSMARVAGEAALRDREHMAETLRVVREEREHLYSGLSSIPGLKPLKSEVNFILVDIRGTGMTALELVEEMGRRGILVRNCSNFYGLDDRHIRLAVRTRKENDALLGAIRGVTRGRGY